MLNTTLVIVKYLATLFSAGYGLYATLNDFHEERDGRRFLSQKGRYGIALLLLSSLLSLSTDVIKDMKEAKDEEARREQDSVATVARDALTSGMHATLGSLETQLATSQQLVRAIKTTSAVASEGARSARRAADTLGQLIQETREAVSAYDVQVYASFDPIAVDSLLGGLLFTDELRGALSAPGSLDQQQVRAVTGALDDHRNAVRAFLLQQWRMELNLRKEGPDGRPLYTQDLVYSVDEGIASLWFTSPQSGIRTPSGRQTASVLIRYVIPLLGIPGLRTFRDLNGARITFVAEGVSGRLALRQAFATLGTGGGRV